MITRQQLRDVVRREVDLQIDTNAPGLTRRERRKLAAATHRKAWNKSAGNHRQVIAAIVSKNKRDTEKANEIIARMA